MCYPFFKMENKEIFSKSALKALIIPLLVEQVLAVTVGLSDVMMVSNVGEAAISGVSLVDMINNLMIAIFAALATGGAVVTAQCRRMCKGLFCKANYIR